MPPHTEPVTTEDDLLDVAIASEFAAIVPDEPLPDDPATIEQLAATLFVPLALDGLPAAVPDRLLAEIERRGDAGAAALLEAVAVLAGEPVAAGARAAAARLADAGVVSPLAGTLGTLSVREATRVAGPDGEIVVVFLRRKGSRQTQLGLLGIDRGESGGALASCLLTPPIGAARARRILDDVADAECSSAQPVALDELVDLVRTAARRTVDIGLALDAESAIALPVISRALTGDPLGLPRTAVLPPWDDDDEGLLVDATKDEDGFHAVMTQLLDGFEQHATTVHPPSSVIWHSGDFVVSCMLEWKGSYGDGRLGRWTGDDLAEFLLDYIPRKVSARPETVDAVPECVIAFLEFLDARGSLSGDPLEYLEEACESLRDPFRERVDDPAGWGLAKSMAMQMLGEGIDPDDPDAVEAWMADFNDRPPEQRDAIMGQALERMLGTRSSSRAAASRTPKRGKQRKAQRSARKRNRRR